MVREFPGGLSRGQRFRASTFKEAHFPDTLAGECFLSIGQPRRLRAFDIDLTQPMVAQGDT
jgi:hypothetical protein